EGCMRSRLALPAALAIAVAGAVFAVSHLVSPAAPTGAGAASLPVAPASYLGVYEKGPPGSYQPVAAFTRAAGRQPNLVGYYGGWGEPFEVSFAATVRRHDAVTLLQWDPTFASVPRITVGGYDGYLRSFADSVRAFGS